MNVDADTLARLFHQHYERLAPRHGYQTRSESAVPWEEVPSRNRSLMVATAAAVLEEIDGDFWPERTFAAALEVFGPAVYAETGRTRKALDRRIQHALRVWREKYGPLLNAKQEEYADLLLAHAVKKGLGVDAKYAIVQAEIGRLVNHERVHAGFLDRQDHVRVDVGDLIGAAA